MRSAIGCPVPSIRGILHTVSSVEDAMPAADEILEPLDAYAFPMLDNGYVYLAATRLSLFRSSTDWAVAVEVFGYSPRAGVLQPDGWRDLADRARLKSEYMQALTRGLDSEALESLATALSDRFNTQPVQGDPHATIERALAAVFGAGG